MSDRREPIAIIGMGCRFPGHANSPEAFWELLRNGVDAISDIPADRPQLMQVYDPDPSKPGRSYLRRGGFVDGVEQWDAAFFGISPREAAHIDPQHRLLLEVAWEALEDAGQNVDRLAGSRTGVFVGISTHDYSDTQCDPVNRHLLDTHSNSGGATSIAANRISYLYDLRGPSFTVDTACSSSLTATHLACNSLLAGECDLAIVGGVQLQLNPELTIGFCKASMISPTGQCRAFDASANGYVRSEGAGVVVLKPLANAIADGDPIHAVILGSAINQDGRTVGMTVPSPIAQEAMLRTALASAQLAATDVHYVEAHGTGTPVGDPLETQALGAVLREGRTNGDYCRIGSVKSNIGHLEAASGIAGLIKAALCVKHREIPPSLHFTSANPAIDLDGGRMRVATALEQWPVPDAPATAGVNSFGFGGANAHVILREPPVHSNGRATISEATLLPLSARSPDALTAMARRYMTLLSNPSADLAQVATAAAHRRAHHEFRTSILASTREEAIDALDAVLAGETRATVATGRRSDHGGKLAFVFSGMGPQWWAMGRQLRAENRAFREMIERCHDALRPHAPWGLIDELARDEATSRIFEPDLAQVTNFAIQVALAAVWKSWGIVPDAVVGHSAGEMAAAYVSGALTLEEAVKVSYHRSRLQSDADPGKIAAVGMSSIDVERILLDFDGAIDLAAVNSPVSCTVAGEASAIEALHERLQGAQIFSRILSFAVPYHSRRMDPIRDELVGMLSDIRPRAATIPIISTVTGTWAEGTFFGASYWFENVRRTVRFADAISTLVDGEHMTLLEMSPHPVLGGSIQECIAPRGAKVTVLATLRRKEDERASLLRSLGTLYTQGRSVNWDGVFDGRRAQVKLPSYPWQHERHWFESAPPVDVSDRAAAGNDAGVHPLLGRRVRAAHPLWESSLAGDDLAFLEDHVIQGGAVFPGAAYVEMALNAARAALPNAAESSVRAHSIAFKRALFLPTRSRALLQLSIDSASREFEIHGSAAAPGADPTWTLHASGELSVVEIGEQHVSLADIRARCTTEVAHDDCYAALARRGLEYGPAFRGIAQLWTGASEAVARIEAPVSSNDYQLHPALLDAAFQLLISAGGGTSADGGPSESGVFLPVVLRSLVLHKPAGDRFWAHARLVSLTDDAIEGDIDLFDDDGRLLATAAGFRCQRLADAARESLDDWLYEFRWEQRDLSGMVRPSVVERTPQDLAELMLPEADAMSAPSHWGNYYGLLESRLDELAHAYVQKAREPIIAARDRQPLAKHLAQVLHGGADLLTEPSEIGRAIIADFPAYASNVALISRCGEQLGAIVAGQIDAASVLFGDGGALITRFYRESPTSLYYNALTAATIAAAGARGNDRPLRILEIGGGTGGTTALVLPHLDPTHTEYVFTDVSTAFTEQAKTAFGGASFFTTRVLDVERDPVAQGFAPHSFDIVLAANVVHATAHVADTLANVRRLLAPGGMLVQLEITRPPLWIDLIFGLTDGWWRFADQDVRPTHALLGSSAWRAALERAGFDDVAAIADSAHDGEAAQTILVARAPAVANEQPVVVGDWVIVGEGYGAAAALSERLTTLGVNATIVSDDDSLAAALDAKPRGIVHVGALDSPPLRTLAPDDALDSQRPGVVSVLSLVQTLIKRGEPMPALCLVTAGAQQHGDAPDLLAVTQSTLWGLGRVITKEQPGLRTCLVDVSATPMSAEIDALARELTAEDWEDELALRGDERFVRRLHRVSIADAAAREPRRPAEAGESFRAAMRSPGALESVELRRVEREQPGSGQVEIAVAAASINFRDVMVAMGLYPTLPGEASFGRGLLGLDCAGTVTAVGDGVTHLAAGDEVVGIAAGTFGAYVTTPAAVVTKRPKSLSVSQGAAVPSVFVTAYYSLVHLARLQRGERVLIHSATGGVGLAAIQVAREVGAEIFATAGSAEKRRYLESLGIEHVMDSRSLQFADDIMQRTNGEGVDVVLNSLAGDAIAKGIGVLRGYGRFVEIGKRDIYQDSRIGLLSFRKNLSFFGVDVDLLSLHRPALACEMLQRVLERFENGTFTALPQQEFPISRVEDAMRFVAQAKHIGKVVLTFDDPDVRVAPAGDGALFRADATYLVTGGLGGFGLAVAQWMAREGARNIVLIGRSAPNADAEQRIHALRESGVRVDVKRADVTRAADVQHVLADIRSSCPPLRGIVHAAMVLDDAPLAALDPERLARVMAPKMTGAWHLHRETLDDPIEHFVMFSSLTAMFGNPLQANYAAANAFLDALAYQRRALGKPGLSINWGPLSGVGYVSRHRDVADYLDRQGYRSFTPAQAFDVLGTLMRRGATHVTAARIDWARWAASSPTAAASAMLRHFAPAQNEIASRQSDSSSLRATLLATPAEERRAAGVAMLRERVGRVLGLSPAKLDPDRPLTELGLDSLIAVELMTVLHVQLGVEIAAVKLLQGITIAGLTGVVLEQIGGSGVNAKPPVRSEPAVVAKTADERGAPPEKHDTPIATTNHNHPPAANIISTPSVVVTATSPAITTTHASSGGTSRYATLDYSAWTPSQRAIRAVVGLGVRTLAKVNVDGIENLPRSGGCLLAINHLSMADVPLVLSVLPRRTIMFASEHLRSSAFMNWFLADMGDAIYVRRGEGDTEALAAGLAVLRAGGLLGLGPEGTRSKNGSLARGRTGIAYLAAQANVPVVPLAAWGQEHLSTKWRSMRRAPIEVRIGSPIHLPLGNGDAAHLRDGADRVMQAIANMLPESYRGVYADAP